MKKWIIIGSVVLILLLIFWYFNEQKKTKQAQAEIDLQRQLAGRDTQTPAITQTSNDLNSILSSALGIFNKAKENQQQQQVMQSDIDRFQAFQRQCIAKHPGNMNAQTECMTNYQA